MYLTRYTPQRLQNGRQTTPVSFFDELFEDFFGPVLHPANRPAAAARRQVLQVDMYEKENGIVIEAEMPGVAKEDIKVDVKGSLLTLTAERKRATEVKDEHSLRRERSYGTVARSFNLPFEIDTENVQASLTNGVLRLEIAKPAVQQPRQITIN